MSALDRQQLDLADVAGMLDCIPAVEREVWLRVAMALKSEFGDAAFEAWDTWSRMADNYVSADAAAVWRSITEGAVTIATLVHLAREHGWRPEGGTLSAPRPFPARSRAESTPAPDTGRRVYALELWLRAIRDDCIAAQHAYVQRKGFTAAHGAGVVSDVRCRQWEEPEQCLIVPIRQRGVGRVIATQCITGDGRKVTFGSMTADDGSPAYLLLGNTLDPDCRWFVVEGWADAASLTFHVYGGNAVSAIAFGIGRLEKVAHQVVEDFPGRRRLVIVEDAQ